MRKKPRGTESIISDRWLIMGIYRDSKNYISSGKEYILKRQAWLSRGFGRIFFEPSRRVTNLRQLLLLYRDDPMSQAAIKKRSKDLFEAGFKVTGADKELTDAIERFIKDKFIRMPWKFARAARDALIYGNGFLEMDFANDQNVARPELEPEGNDIIALHSINPEQMIIIEEDRPDEENYGRITGYFSMPPLTGAIHTLSFLTVTESHKSLLGLGKRLHPDRIIHIKFDTVGDSNLGLSVLEPAFNIMKSKIDTDISLGVITTKFSKPILEFIVKKGTKPAEMQRADKMARDINKNANKVSHIVHDENLEFKIPGVAGKSLRIKEYYDIMLDQLAIQFGVPKRLLIGSEAGSISGSELNLVAYFQSIESDQNTIMKPLIMKLLNQWHIATRGEELPEDVDIVFGRLYADEINAVKANMLDTQSVVAAEKAGLITKEGARKKLSDVLGIDFSEDDEDYSEPQAGFGGGERGKDNPFKSPQDKQPGIKFPSEEEMDDVYSDIEELKLALSELKETGKK